MLKLKLQYFGNLMQRADSLEKTPMLGKTESKRRRGWQRRRWLDGITDSTDMSLSKLWEIDEGQGSLACCSRWGHKESDTTYRLKWLQWSLFHESRVIRKPKDLGHYVKTQTEELQHSWNKRWYQGQWYRGPMAAPALGTQEHVNGHQEDLMLKWRLKLQWDTTSHLSERSSLKNLSTEKKDHPPYCWQKCKLVQLLWKTVRRFLKKLNIKLPYNPVIPLLCTYLEKTTLQKDTLTPMFRAALFTIAKI